MTALKKTIVGKVGSKKRLHESDEQHAPEQLEEFTVKAQKDVQDLQKIFTAFKSKVGNLSIVSMLEDPSEAESLSQKIKTATDYAKQKHEYYFNIVEPYDWMDLPPNVKQLDKLVTKLDELQNDLGYIKYAMDGLVEAAKDFNRFYQSQDEES